MDDLKNLNEKILRLPSLVVLTFLIYLPGDFVSLKNNFKA